MIANVSKLKVVRPVLFRRCPNLGAEKFLAAAKISYTLTHLYSKLMDIKVAKRTKLQYSVEQDLLEGFHMGVKAVE